MRKRFVACASCNRHVREGDAACPFCGAAALPLPPAPRASRHPITRAALFAAGAAGTVAVLIDCSDGSAPQPAPFYGIACTGDACGIVETDAGDGGVVAADAKVADASGDDGDGGDGGSE